MKRFACLLAFLLLVVTMASAQKCSNQTVLGTYAFQISGSVLAGAPPSPASPLTTNAVHRDNVMIGIVTYRPDGIISGFYWQANGSQATLSKLPWQAVYTVNEDCTGYYEYSTPLADKPVRENFFVLNGGYEIHMMLASDAAEVGAKMPFALMNYSGVAYRITRQMAPHCSRYMALGTKYNIQCNGSMLQDVSNMGGLMVLSTSSLINIKVGWDANVTGDHMVKVGPTLKDFNVTGAMNVNEDCTGDADFIYSDPSFTGTVKVRTVFYDYGARGLGLPMFTILENGTSIPFQGWSCQWMNQSPGLKAIAY